jgi:uncharacterized protein YggU (UPF0235/DUF167 family)
MAGQPYLAKGYLGLRLTVRAHPGAKQAKMRRTERDSVEIWVRAPAIDGRANLAIEQALSERLSLARSAVRVVRGANARLKIIEIECSSDVTLEALGPIDTAN